MSRKMTNLKKHKGRNRRQVKTGTNPITGKPIVEEKSFDTKTEADIWAENTRNALRNNTYVKDTGITVGEWSDKWLAASHVDTPTTHATYIMYEQLIRIHIKPRLGHIKLIDLKVMDINTALNAMFAEGLTRRIEMTRMAFNQICEAAVWDNLMPRNPVPRSKLPNIIKEPKEPLSEQDLDLLLNCDIGIQEKAFVYIGLFGCLRRSEILGLKVTSLKAGEINVRGVVTFNKSVASWKPVPKTVGSFRTFRLPKIAQEAVDQLKGTGSRKNIYLFSSETGDLLSETSYRAMWLRVERKLNEAAGGVNPWNGRKAVKAARHITPHLLRHTGCTIMYYAGFTALEAAYVMGHDDINTTMSIYTHLDKSSLGHKKYAKYYPDFLEILGKRPPEATATQTV